MLSPPGLPGQPLESPSLKGSKNKNRYPAGFPLLLAGIICLSLAHVLIDNFMLQIMQSLGGGTENLGLALSIAAFVEVPAIWLYGKLRRRLSDQTFLVFAVWPWAFKTFLIFLAESPTAIYAAEVLQFCSYAFYTPSIVCCVDRWFPPESRLRGQSLVGSAYTLGCVLAAVLGGTLLDALGVPATLLILVGIACMGAALVSAASWTRKTHTASL